MGNSRAQNPDEDAGVSTNNSTQLIHRLGFLSLFGFEVVLGNTWPYALIGITMSLQNGGPLGAMCMLGLVIVGMGCVGLSFAEMCSINPTAAGQYQWVFFFAPSKYRHQLSYAAGWFSVVGWQVGMASTAFAVTQQLLSLVAMNNPSFEIMGWHGTLLTIAIALISILWNTLLVDRLPLLEGIAVIIYVLGFVAFVTILSVMGVHTNVNEVFSKIHDPSGWGDDSISTLVSINGAILVIGCADSGFHMTEETRNSRLVQPKAVISSFSINSILALAMTFVTCWSLGNDIPALIDTPIGQPWIQILVNTTGSITAASIMVAVVCVLLTLGSVNQLSTASRQLFTFARDSGLPASHLLSKVWRNIPLNAIFATFVFTVFFSLIPIFSTVAFNILVSLSFVSLHASFILAISSLLWYRVFSGCPLPCSPFSLGKWGIFVNSAALCYLALASFFLFFPPKPNPSLEEMNWACVLFFTLTIFCGVCYWWQGRHKYKQPILQNSIQMV